jgi:glycogen(starch) synthase
VASTPRKLLIYSMDFSPSVGGIQSVVMTLVQGFANPNLSAPIDCTVVTKTPAAGGDSDAPCRIVRNPSLGELIRLLREADLVHLAGPAVRPLVLSLILRKPMIVEHHGFQALCPNGLLFYEPARTACPGHFLAEKHLECWKCNSGSGRLKSVKLWATTFLRRWLCQSVSANVAPTFWVSKSLRLPRTSVMLHGICNGPATRPATTVPPTFVFIGRLVSTKGVDLLLRSSHELLKRGFEFQLRIIGDGPERNNLERLCAHLGITHRIEFTGEKTGSSLESLLLDVTAVIVPSISGETFGLVAAENMMRGRLVIVPDSGALAEVVGDHGLKFTPGDARSLAACMQRVLRSPEIITQIGEDARKYSLSRYRAEQMVASHLALYEKVLP